MIKFLGDEVSKELWNSRVFSRDGVTRQWDPEFSVTDWSGWPACRECHIPHPERETERETAHQT